MAALFAGKGARKYSLLFVPAKFGNFIWNWRSDYWRSGRMGHEYIIFVQGKTSKSECLKFETLLKKFPVNHEECAVVFQFQLSEENLLY